MAVGQSFLELLAVLTRHRVEFVIVGATAAVLEGAPMTTFDLDVVFEPSPANRARLLAALTEIDAVYVDPLRRTEALLSRSGCPVQLRPALVELAPDRRSSPPSPARAARLAAAPPRPDLANSASPTSTTTLRSRPRSSPLRPPHLHPSRASAKLPFAI